MPEPTQRTRKRKSEEPHERRRSPRARFNPSGSDSVMCEEPGERRSSPRVRFNPDGSDSAISESPGEALGATPVLPYVRYEPRDPPIMDYASVPAGWNPEDYDIPEHDIEANIKRCNERIEDGIMPHWWVEKLKIYEKEKRAVRDTLKTMPAGLDWNVITRVKNLEQIQRHLLHQGDKFCQLDNVKALITAYKDKSLGWDGKVTYLSKGKPLARGKFKWEDVKKYNDQCNGQSFWVEGLNGPGPTMMKPFNNFRPFKTVYPQHSDHQTHCLDFHVRVPGERTMVDDIRLPFLDDTGAEMPRLFNMDLMRLVSKASGRSAPFLCYHVMRTANDWIVEPTCMLEFNISRADGGWAREWVPQQVSLGEGYTIRATDRLSGMWMRQLFYVSTCPDNNGGLYVAETRGGLGSVLNRVDTLNAVPSAPDCSPSEGWEHLTNWKPYDLLISGPQGGPYLTVPGSSGSGSSSPSSGLTSGTEYVPSGTPSDDSGAGGNASSGAGSGGSSSPSSGLTSGSEYVPSGTPSDDSGAGGSSASGGSSSGGSRAPSSSSSSSSSWQTVTDSSESGSSSGSSSIPPVLLAPPTSTGSPSPAAGDPSASRSPSWVTTSGSSSQAPSSQGGDGQSPASGAPSSSPPPNGGLTPFTGFNTPSAQGGGSQGGNGQSPASGASSAAGNGAITPFTGFNTPSSQGGGSQGGGSQAGGSQAGSSSSSSGEGSFQGGPHESSSSSSSSSGAQVAEGAPPPPPPPPPPGAGAVLANGASSSSSSPSGVSDNQSSSSSGAHTPAPKGIQDFHFPPPPPPPNGGPTPNEGSGASAGPPSGSSSSGAPHGGSSPSQDPAMDGLNQAASSSCPPTPGQVSPSSSNPVASSSSASQQPPSQASSSSDPSNAPTQGPASSSSASQHTSSQAPSSSNPFESSSSAGHGSPSQAPSSSDNPFDSTPPYPSTVSTETPAPQGLTPAQVSISQPNSDADEDMEDVGPLPGAGNAWANPGSPWNVGTPGMGGVSVESDLGVPIGSPVLNPKELAPDNSWYAPTPGVPDAPSDVSVGDIPTMGSPLPIPPSVLPTTPSGTPPTPGVPGNTNSSPSSDGDVQMAEAPGL